VTFSYFAVPFALILLLLPDGARRSRYMRPFTYAVFLAATYFLLFDAAAEYFFFEEFGTRFNFIAVDYLVYTTEVLRTSRSRIRFRASSARSSPSMSCWSWRSGNSSTARFSRRTNRHPTRSGEGCGTQPRWRAPVLSFAFVNVSMTGFPETISPTSCRDGIYDFGAAFRNNELDFDRFYATEEKPHVLAGLRELLREPTAAM